MHRLKEGRGVLSSHILGNFSPAFWAVRLRESRDSSDKQSLIHFEDNNPPRRASFNERGGTNQVKPPTILSAASWPRLQFQLSVVDDDKTNHL